MNRVEFMSQLERLLCNIPDNDRQDAVAYYNDYFDEAGPENEARVIRELGSPGRVAATIEADLRNGGNGQAEYKEHGYQDGKGDLNPPSKKEGTSGNAKQKRNLPWSLIIILIIFASPILLGVGGGILGGIVGILGGFVGIIIALLASCVALLVSGAVCLVVGVVRTFMSPVDGLALVAVGSILLALGLLLLILFGWCAFKWLPALFRWIVNGCQELFHRGERRSNV